MNESQYSPDVSGSHVNEPLKAATQYACHGLRVIPIKPGTKHPGSILRWQEMATTDPEVVRQWWTGKHQGWGVGLVLGTQPNGTHIFAVDLDRHREEANGPEAFKALAEKHGGIPQTVRAKTGGGGHHLLYSAPAGMVTNSTADLGPGIDIRGQGGQIVVWPSVHPETGEQYRWAEGLEPWNHQIAEAPAWLLELVIPKEKPPREKPPKAEKGTVTPITAAPSRPAQPLSKLSPADYIRATWDWEAELIADGWTQDPDRDPEEWTRPGKKAEHGSSATLHDEGPLVVWSTTVLSGWPAGTGTKAGSSGTSVSAYEYFVAQRHNGDTKAANGQIRGWQWNLEGIVAGTTEAKATTPASQSHTEATEEPVDSGTTPAEEPHESYLDKIRANLRRGEEVLTKEPVTWLVKNWIPNNSFGVIYGAPGSGKSFYAMTLALEVARGGQWLGTEFTEPASVLYIAAERGNVLGERQRAWKQYNSCPIPDTFYELELAPQILTLEHLASLMAVVREIRPRLVIVDTLAQVTEGVNENDGQEWGLVGSAFEEILRATDGGNVIAVHHSGKDTSKGMRGHSSLNGEITWSIEIRKGQDGLQSLLEKHNAGPDQDPEWYRYEPVDLPAPDGDIFPITSVVLVETTYRAVAGEREAQVLEFISAEERIEEGASLAEIAAWLEPLSKATVNRVIKKLKEAGQIETQGQTKNLRYYLAGHLRLQRRSAYLLPDEPF